MAFINERIPEEEKEKLTFDVFTQPDGSKPTLWKWTVDRERKAFLVLTNIDKGGYSDTDPIEYFVLIWNEQLIRFSGEYKVSGIKGNGYSVAWQVSELEIPDKLQNKKPEVFVLIREALDVKGLSYVRVNINTVTVSF